MAMECLPFLRGESMFQRVLWKLMPKSQRAFLLGRMAVVDRAAVNRSMSGNLRYPEPFRRQGCLFIHVPKCAGSSVGDALFGGWRAGHLPLYWYEQQFPTEYATAFKFSFVRDPLERAFSAYVYLRGNELRPRHQAAKRLVSSYQGFDDFVARWLNVDNVRRQIHFAPQTDFLMDSLGHLALDFIGYQEHLERDFTALCELLGCNRTLPHSNPSLRREVLPVKDICTARTREIVRRVYQRDYELLGYA